MNSARGMNRPPITRMAQIHDALRAGRPINCTTFAKKWEVSPKTIQRDIEHMRDQFKLPIEYDPSGHRYRYSAPVSSALFGEVGHGPRAALPLDDGPAGHLAVICERHGLRADDVLRAVLGESLDLAVHNSGFMDTIVRAARVFSMQGTEAA